MAACDAYEAMRSGRADRLALPEDAVLAELERCAGTQFDPAVVTALPGVLAASPVPVAAR